MTSVPWAGIAWWALVGALAGLAVVSLLSIGVLVAPVVLALGAGGLLSQRLRRGIVPGLLLGVSLVPLGLAWLNRSGPGLVCSTTATSQSCAEQWNPWPFVLAGVLLLAAGVAVVRRSVPARA
ncbi:hypothetical protein [Oryzobacter terrae]|uniref:hypothetical protein n=1 Tax=Oryzobacter terrae TaxID=1620385 RepID=UPI00366ECA74